MSKAEKIKKFLIDVLLEECDENGKPKEKKRVFPFTLIPDCVYKYKTWPFLGIVYLCIYIWGYICGIWAWYSR